MVILAAGFYLFGFGTTRTRLGDLLVSLSGPPK